MKRGTVRYYVKVALGLSIFMTLGQLLALFGSGPRAWQTILLDSVELGFILGFAMALGITRMAVTAAEGKELSPEDVKWLGSRQWTEVELPLGLVDSLQLVEETLRTTRRVVAMSTDAGNHKVTARTRGSFRTHGEVITVTLTPVGELASATTRSMIESRCAFRLNMGDFGKNKANVEGVALALNQAVNKRLQAQREAAQTASMQAQLHQARLSLLQAQVEPHFLYNTLANLQLLIRCDPAAADEMADDLIKYLRLSMPEFRGVGFTLGRELELVRAYLGIMKIRLRERLDIHIESDGAAAGLAFPPLLLHTLVENSIKHGIEPKPEGGKISIVVGRMGNGQDKLRITVADTGIGLESDQEGSGVGLANLRERLDLLHHGRASLELTENLPSGVICTLEIPCEVPRAA